MKVLIVDERIEQNLKLVNEAIDSQFASKSSMTLKPYHLPEYKEAKTGREKRRERRKQERKKGLIDNGV